MNQEKQPKAIRLADWLDNGGWPSYVPQDAAAELRRLHAENEQLMTALASLVGFDSYETEYAGRIYTICPACSGQDGEHSKTCDYVSAKALISKIKESDKL